jgi:hypothetical protein
MINSCDTGVRLTSGMFLAWQLYVDHSVAENRSYSQFEPHQMHLFRGLNGRKSTQTQSTYGRFGPDDGSNPESYRNNSDLMNHDQKAL